MEFYDKVTITVKSGRGWDGIATGRREKHVPFGGPAGWDGWNGGSIIMQWSQNEYTLLPFRMQRVFNAKHGEQGKGKDQYGKSADDMILNTPIGTVIRDSSSKEIIATIEHHGQQFVVAQWGRGWLGNKHFVSAEKQYSTIALLGEPGNERDLILELRLLSDIALIWLPSVGKSSIINMIANTKAKTAEYHFTTIVPNMGMVEWRSRTFSVIDIPGLIKWAHSGKWLGNAFLRHIIKSKLLLFVVDAGKYEPGMHDVWLLIEELKQYVDQTVLGENIQYTHTMHMTEWWISYEVSHGDTVLFQKFLGFVINKIDIINDQEILNDYTQTFLKEVHTYLAKTFSSSLTPKQLAEHCIHVSAATTAGKQALIDYMEYRVVAMEQYDTVQPAPAKPFTKKQSFELSTPQLTPTDENTLAMLVEENYIQEEQLAKNTIRTVDNQEIAYLSFVIPRWNDEAELWYRSQLAQKWYLDERTKYWFKKWDILHIVSPYAGVDDRFIIRS